MHAVVPVHGPAKVGGTAVESSSSPRNLSRVRFLNSRNSVARNDAAENDPPAAGSGESVEEVPVGKAFTPTKGRPTPKRRDSEARKRGPVAPAPRTQREAMKRARGNKEERRRTATERRERMAAGDDRYLTARDRGPVRAYVRDVVDSRRHLLGLFMPMALLIFVVLFTPNLMVQQYVTMVVLLVLAVMFVEGVVIGRATVKKVREKFPEAPDRGFSLGWYAAVRASQIRKLRMPKPRVKPGEEV